MAIDGKLFRPFVDWCELQDKPNIFLNEVGATLWVYQLVPPDSKLNPPHHYYGSLRIDESIMLPFQGPFLSGVVQERGGSDQIKITIRVSDKLGDTIELWDGARSAINTFVDESVLLRYPLSSKERPRPRSPQQMIN